MVEQPPRYMRWICLLTIRAKFACATLGADIEETISRAILNVKKNFTKQ